MGGKGRAIVGGLIMLAGIVVTVVSMGAAQGGGTYIVAWGAILFGGIQLVRGLMAAGDDEEDGQYYEEPAPAAAHFMPAVTLPVRVSGSVTDADYPATALEAGREGEVIVSFLVDQEGLPRRPEIVTSSGDSALDDAACQVIERSFRYQIPRDADGNPTLTTEIERIVWQLPATT